MSKAVSASVFAAAGLTGVMTEATPPDYITMWKDFQSSWAKVYTESESQQRFDIFKNNVDIINEQNAKGHSHKLGITEFADLTANEFSDRYLGYRPDLRKNSLEAIPWVSPNLTAPDSLDWVTKGAVTPVKNQASCGSCWAFSTTGSVEGAYFVATGKLVSVSEEELVECDHNGDSGCKGGAMDNAYEWIKKSGGICSESSYPYTSGKGSVGICKKGCSSVVTLTGHTDVPSGDEKELLKAVAQQPISVAIEADRPAFQLYKNGILDNPECGKKLDHGVLLVGYGTDNGKDYWKVKNSWGPSWGEHGYLRIARGKNMCGIAMMASYPTGAKKAAPAPPSPPTPPTPPSPAPSPKPAHSHYEDPSSGCQSDEVRTSIQGVSGAICAPMCSTSQPCPTDVPKGVTVSPSCALKDSTTSSQFCALLCIPDKSDGQCGKHASCKRIQAGVGICTYDDATELSDALSMVFQETQTQARSIVV